MNQATKKTPKTPTQEAMSKLGSYGGLAVIKKYGKGHMSKLIKSRWDKKRAKKVDKVKK